MRIKNALVLCVLALASGGAASETSGVETADEKFRARILLDGQADTAARDAQVQLVEREARRGDAYAQYVLGSLYRLGKRHPAAVLERDDDKAAIYLSNAATKGQIFALAGMAELELDRKRPKDAMVWAQAFALYQGVKRHEKDTGNSSRQAYAAYLIQRVTERIENMDEAAPEIDRALVAFQQRHDATIRAALGAHGAIPHDDNAMPQEELKLLVPAAGRWLGTPTTAEERLRTPGQTVFLLGVDAQGSVQTALVIDSLPDDAIAEGLRRSAMHIRFNPAKGSELRWAILPLGFDNFSVRLKQQEK